jgi:hypothetical protein
VKKICCLTCFGSHKYHKIENYFRKKFKKLKNFLRKKFSLSSKKIGLGSGIREKPVPDPGSGIENGTGSRIRISNTGF